mmetsp:Transcript_39672/g.109282  ORF Transcript_39672/g.109282 Transcript_39672/m.109282 type:complete len:318 (+) Transcript_39672:53-1006(+)
MTTKGCCCWSFLGADRAAAIVKKGDGQLRPPSDDVVKRAHAGDLIIKDLLVEHRAAIDVLKKSLSKSGNLAAADDDIFLLRYVLSFPDPAAAEEAVLKAKRYRREHAGLFASAAKGEVLPCITKFDGKLPVGVWEHRTDLGQVVYIVRTGFCDSNVVLDEADQKDILDNTMYHKEVIFLELDRMTRKTGVLLKCFTVLDFENVTMFGRPPPGTTEASAISGYLYPQMAAKTIMINMPWFFGTLFSIVKPLLPAKVLEKIAMCPAKGTSSAARREISECPFASSLWSDPAKIPAFLGGTCPVSRVSSLWLAKDASVGR